MIKILSHIEFMKSATLACLVGGLAFLAQSAGIANVTEELANKDTLVRWSGTLSGATRLATPVTLIDIDDATLAARGSADRAPRDLIAELIDLVSAKKPLGIFVDLDTSRAGASNEADQRLKSTITHYPLDAPFLSFARRFIPAEASQPATELRLVPLPSILDDALQGHPNILMTSSAVPRDSDQVVRRWQLSQTICTTGHEVSYASPQLVATALRTQQSNARSAIDEFLNWRTRHRCAKDDSLHPLWPRNPESNATIWYVQGADDDASPGRLIEHQGQQAQIIRRISASTLLTPGGKIIPPKALADHLLSGRFVVIGSSHVDSFDTHQTPIGQLPGSVIIANAIATAPATLDSYPLPPWLRGALAFIIFAVLAALTRKLRGIIAGPLVAVLLIVILLLLGSIFVPTTALEIIYTAIAMIGIFAGLESVFEIVHAWRHGKGWRAILKSSAASASKES